MAVSVLCLFLAVPMIGLQSAFVAIPDHILICFLGLDLVSLVHHMWPGPEVIKGFSYSTQQSTKFQLLIKLKCQQ